MSWARKEAFYEFIIKNQVIGFFQNPIKLKSGRNSTWYVNWRNIAEDVHLIDLLSDFVIDFIENLKLQPDCIYGVPEGATKLGILSQFKWAKRQKTFPSDNYILSMGRGKPKEHGDPKDKYFLGVPRGKVIIIEDTITTGGSLIQTIKTLRELNIDIIATIGLTDRNELRDDGLSVKDAIDSMGLTHYSMSDALELLPMLKPEDRIKQHIIDYFAEYGIREIEF